MRAVRGVRLTPSRVLSVLGLGLVALAVAALLAAAFGEYPLQMSKAFEAGTRERFMLVELRLPRILLAAVIGAALSAAGAALQALLRNALADPFVLGVSGGAALGGTLALAFGGAALAAGLAASAEASLPHGVGAVVGGILLRSPTTLAALFGALLATLVVYAAGRFGGRLSPFAALLAGVIFNALASAAITFIKALSPPDRVGDLLYWLAGSLEYPTWPSVLGLVFFEGAAVLVLLVRAPELNLLSLGDEGAASLGVDVERVRRQLFAATSFAVAAAVAVSGLIGFVGLIVPHVLRLWLGPDQRLLMPASVVGGAVFLVLADLGARVLFQSLGTSTPVGVLTALIGGPVFLWLLRRTGARLGVA